MNESVSRERVVLDFFGLSFSDVASIGDELSNHFWDVEVRKGPTPPAASPLFGEYSVILVIVSLAAAGFFSELGKDAYRKVARLLATAARKAKPIRDSRGGCTLGLRIMRSGSKVTFVFMQPPVVPDVLKVIPSDRHVFAHFQTQTRTWRWEAASIEVQHILNKET